MESREKFLRKMIECGFFRPDNAPTEEAAQALPTDVPHMTKEEGKRHTNSLGGERKTTNQAEGKRFVDHGLRINRGEGWLPGTQ